jgi:hypothetical protein
MMRCTVMRQRRSLLLALLAAAGFARAADLQAEVLKRLDAAPVLQGEFEQSRSLKGFKNPLVSRGDFLLARSRGIVWETRQPFASTLVITRDHLLARRADGSIATQLDASKEPALRLVNEVMFALLAGDLGALAGRFKVEGELQGARSWRLQLTPTDALLAGQFSGIALEGDRHVKLVRLAERNGDLTQIRFGALRGAASLSPEAARRFDEAAHGA